MRGPPGGRRGSSKKALTADNGKGPVQGRRARRTKVEETCLVSQLIEYRCKNPLESTKASWRKDEKGEGERLREKKEEEGGEKWAAPTLCTVAAKAEAGSRS